MSGAYPGRPGSAHHEGASGTPLAPVSSVIESSASPQGLALTRSGSPIQENALAAPQRVGYRLREGVVEYLLWPSAPATGAQPSGHAVLGDVAELRFTALR